jgi:hypothetical protein
MTPAADAVLVAAAGVLAGVVGTAGGITSLVSYPALLAVGLPALPANVANLVALTACWPGSALASRPELAGRGAWLRRWAWAAAAGGAAGAALLLLTPPGAFGRVVPFLVAAGSLALLAQPRVAAWRRGRDHVNAALLLAGLVAVSVYGGYFGAGSGVLTLGLVLLAVDPDLPRANALKNMLIGAGSVLAALAFILLSHVDWGVVLPLAAGLFAGSTMGPRLTRRVPAPLLRWLIALLGLGLAVRLWFVPV